MEKQVCRKCNTEYSIEFFELANVIKGKEYRRRQCRFCRALVKKKRRHKLRDWFDSLRQELKCKNCEENRWYVLDFHHRDPEEKEIHMGNCIRIGWSKQRILKEVKKCDVLCANCHRELHWLEKNN